MLYAWRYKSRNLSRMKRESYPGVQFTTDDWSKLLQDLERMMSLKAEHASELPLSPPNEVIDYFAAYLVSGGGSSHVFLKSLRLTPDPKVETIALTVYDQNCDVALSEVGIELFIEGIQELTSATDPDLDQWPIRNDSDKHQCLKLHPYPKHTPGLPRASR